MTAKLCGLVAVALFALAGCGTSTVFSDWECDTPTGSCATIAQVDAAATEASVSSLGGPPAPHQAEGAIERPAPSAAFQPSPRYDDSVRPNRTVDVTAKVVFAPFVDLEGAYHGRSILYAVMEDGSWTDPEGDDAH